MREIDCSPLPEELSKVALDAAEEALERQPYDDIHGVSILRNTELIVLNGDGRKTLETYGALQQSMLDAVHEALAEGEYTDDEREEYRYAIDFRKA